MRENMDQKNFIFVHVSHSVKFWKPSRQLEKKKYCISLQKGKQTINTNVINVIIAIN